MASPDKTPLERRVESRVKAAELHETLAARWYGEDVPELLSEVVRLRPIAEAARKYVEHRSMLFELVQALKDAGDLSG